MTMDDEHRSALLLTQGEWDALEGLCRFYLQEQRGSFPERVAVAERIIEANR